MEYELWVPAYGFEDETEVSDQGRWRRPQGIARRGCLTKFGYRRFLPRVAGKQINLPMHRVVLQSFWRQPLDGLVVNHLNGVRDDNRLFNLEACTQKENVHHSLYVLGSKFGTNPCRGERNPNSRFTADTVLRIREMEGTMTQREIAAIYGVTQGSINLILRRKNWKHI